MKNGSSGAYFVENVDCSAGKSSWQDHTWVLHWQPDKLTTWVDPVMKWDSKNRIVSVQPKEDSAAHDFPSWRTYDRTTTESWQAVEEFMGQCYPGEATADAPFDQGFKLVLNIAIGGYEGAGCKWGDGCATSCAGAVGSEMVISDITIWETA